MTVKGRDDGTKTLVMPLKNCTQKDVELGPDFRRDDGKGSRGALAPCLNDFGEAIFYQNKVNKNKLLKNKYTTKRVSNLTKIILFSPLIFSLY